MLKGVLHAKKLGVYVVELTVEYDHKVARRRIQIISHPVEAESVHHAEQLALQKERARFSEVCRIGEPTIKSIRKHQPVKEW